MSNVIDTQVSAVAANIEAIYVDLDDAEHSKAEKIAEMRVEKFPDNNLEQQKIGAYAEVAVSRWLTTQGLQIDDAYSNLERCTSPVDIHVGKVAIDVKARTDKTENTEGWWFSVKQAQNLDQVQCVLWCRVYDAMPPPGSGRWGRPTRPKRVAICGWSTPEDISKSPIESRGPQDCYFIEHLRTIDSLLDELRRKQET